MTLPEPMVVYPEEQFQRSIVSLLNAVLSTAQRPFALVEGFGLDIAVFLGGPSQTGVRFFEVKAFGAQRMGGVGFGNGRGQGVQVDLLLAAEGCLPLFDATVRWIYADATQPAGTRRYALLTCEKAKGAAMGGVARGKQNNLRISAFRESLVDWTQLCGDVQRFVLS